MSDMYILGGEDGRTPIPVDDLMEWANWFKTGNRRVAEDYVGSYRVSTVFLGLDHSFSRFFGVVAAPLVFETMIFADNANPQHCDMERCSTWDEAVEQHARVVARLKKELSG